MTFDGLLLSKKYIPSAKIYTKDLSNITFNFLREKSPNDSYHLCHFYAQTLHTFYKSSLWKWKFSQTCQCLHWNSLISSCHFWNQGSAFLRTLHHSSVSWDLLFCTFSSKYLYALDKRIGSKCKLLDFRLLEWKLTKFLMSFFKPQINFPLNFASPFSVMIHNSSEIF